MRNEEDEDDDYGYNKNDLIEEDIKGNGMEAPPLLYDLYQAPVSGGLPIKMVAMDNISRRPFTPPFA